MVFTKLKNLLNPNSYSVNSLIKSTVINRSNNFTQQVVCARLDYLAKFKYSRNLNQGQQIILSNMLVHDSITTYNEVPHIIFHTLDQGSRLQVIPDDRVFNIRNYKCGDFVNVTTEQAIEAKSWSFLSLENLDGVKEQYKHNNLNDNFVFSLFYEKEGNIKEANAKEYLFNKLKLESNQIVIKSFDALSEKFTDEKIEQAILYYNMAWSEYQIENNERLLRYLNVVLNSNTLSKDLRKEVLRYRQLLIGGTLDKSLTKKQRLRYPYKNNQLLLYDNNQVDSIESELTPEAIMADQRVIEFNEEET